MEDPAADSPDLRHVVERYRSFVEHSNEGIFRLEFSPPVPTDLPVSEQARLICERAVLAECNDAFARTYGADKSAASVTGRPFVELSGEEPCLLELYETFVRNGHRLVDSETVFHVDGEITETYRNNAHGIIEDGQLVHVWCINQDITEQRAFENELRYRERFESTLLEISGRLHAVAHDQLDETIVNALCQLSELFGANLGYVFLFDSARETFSMRYLHKSDDRIGYDLRELQRLPVTSVPWWMERIFAGQVVAAPDIGWLPPEASEEHRILSGHGVRGLVDAPLIGADGDVFGIVGFCYTGAETPWREDRTAFLKLFAQLVASVLERDRREHELRESEHRFRVLIDRSPEAVILLEPGTHRIVQANPATESLFRRPRTKLIGKTLEEISAAHQALAAGALEGHLKAAIQGETPVFEWAHLRSDGVEIPCEVRLVQLPSEGTPLVRALIVDIRDRKRDEEERQRLASQLQQALKMEVIGQLSGGIAHDFNNLLAVILGNLQMIEMEPDNVDEVLQLCAQAVGATRRASTLTERLLAFSRQQALDPVALDARELIEELELLLARTLGETIEIRTDLQADLWLCKADRTQLESVLLNLAINARDAMMDGGRLALSAINARIEPNDPSDLSPGEYVKFTIADSGTGMSARVLDHIFEPFFTTKEVGKGTGLGLSMVYGFVKQSDGHVQVESEVGKGTSVHLYLPREVGSAPSSSRTVRHHGPQPIQSKRILVVEDDPQVRTTSSKMLERLGYSTIEAGHALEAIDLINSELSIDLVLTDVVLPHGKSGVDVANHVRTQRPGLPVLLTSGYSENVLNHRGLADPKVELLRKPFTIVQLAGKLTELLGGASAADGEDSPRGES